MQPLSGIRVLDLTRHIAGPLCSQLLGDLGAEVTKLESLRGDDTREEEPFVGRDSLYFASFNRGKKSLSFDPWTEAGRTILKRLVSKSDVLVSNYRNGVMDAMGFSYQACREINPQLVYVTVTGFGGTGRYADRPAFDEIIQAMSGLMHLTGDANGPPTMVGVPIVDMVTGLYGFGATTSALRQRERTGEGALVEVNLYDSALSLINPSITRQLLTGVEDQRTGGRNRYEASIGVFETNDGFLQLCAFSDTHWSRLAGILGGAAMANDPRYKTLAGRSEHMTEVNAIIENWTRLHSTNEVVAELQALDIPASQIKTIADIAADDDLRSSSRLVDVDHARLGTVPLVRGPIRISTGGEEDEFSPLAQPDLGEHTEELLAAAGFSSQEISNWTTNGVVHQAIKEAS